MSDAVKQENAQSLGLDEARLEPYLQAHITGFGSLLGVEKFAGGQSNPTYKVRSSSGDYVLRRKPVGTLLKSAHAVDREFRVLKALSRTDVPVPDVMHLCEDETVLGSMFYVMEFVQGRILWDPALPKLKSEERNAIYDQMNAVLAAIHSVDLNAVGLADYGRQGNYFERQFARWSKQYRASETETIDEMDALIDWLGDNMVADDGRVTLVHGDYRIDNIMFAKDAPRAIAVMDWELSTLGHPFADLAYQCMLWRWSSKPGMHGLKGENLVALGIPEEAAYVEKYCERVGFDVTGNWNFYIAFGFFRLAAIAQGVRKRAIDGTASNDRADQVGALVSPLSATALQTLS